VGLYKYKVVEINNPPMVEQTDWDIWSTEVENLASCMQMHAKFLGTCERMGIECKTMIKCIDAGVAAGHYAVQQR
jgi:hypothetical protein